MARYELSQAADADLERLYIFGIRNFGEGLADQYYDGLISRFQQIADMPKLYPAAQHVTIECRRSVYGAHSIYYEIKETSVVIVRILGRENPETAL